MKWPHNHDAEAALLGLLLRGDESAIADTVSTLPNVEAFYANQHRAVYGAILSLVERGDEVNMTTVASELVASGELSKIGGRAHMVELAEGVATTTTPLSIIKILRDEWTRRRAIKQAHALIEAATNGSTDIDSALGEMSDGLLDIYMSGGKQDWITMDAAVDKAVENIDQYQHGKAQKRIIRTGFSDVDRILEMAPGELIVIGGATSHGKTQLAIQVMEHAALNDAKRVAMVSLEMSAASLAGRSLASLSGIDRERIRTEGAMTSEDWLRLETAAGTLRGATIYFNDMTARTPNTIRMQVEALCKKHGIDLLIVDYLQLIDPDNTGSYTEKEYQLLSRIVAGLKLLAMRTNIVVVLLSQLNRAHTTDGRMPNRNDLFGASAIGNHADAVVLVANGKYKDRDSGRWEKKAAIIIDKQRNGPTGAVTMAFPCGRWALAARQEDAA